MIPEGWTLVKIEDISSKLGDGLHGTPKYTPNGEYAFVNGNNFVNGKIEIKSDTKRVDNVEFEKYKKPLDDRTLFVSINGTLGNVAEYHNEKIILGKSACYFNVKPDVDKYFIKFVLLSRQFQDYLQYQATGTTIKNISLKQMREYKFLLPPLETQRKIAKVLSAIDDKIELNNSINHNLEQQAQAIFKSWFVDFEPFGGKMPEDWRQNTLLEIANYLNGLPMQKYRPVNDENYLHVVKIKELRQGYCDNSSDKCSENIDNAYIIDDGDVIFSWSGTLVLDFWCGGKCGLNQHLFKVTSSKYEKWFYYYWTKYHLDKFIAIAADKATTMGHIKREDLEKSQVTIPSAEIYEKANSIIKPIIDKIISTRVENKTLSLLRDTLLPKLMNGEIDVSKVDAVINKL